VVKLREWMLTVASKNSQAKLDDISNFKLPSCSFVLKSCYYRKSNPKLFKTKSGLSHEARAFHLMAAEGVRAFELLRLPVGKWCIKPSFLPSRRPPQAIHPSWSSETKGYSDIA